MCRKFVLWNDGSGTGVLTNCSWVNDLIFACSKQIPWQINIVSSYPPISIAIKYVVVALLVPFQYYYQLHTNLCYYLSNFSPGATLLPQGNSFVIAVSRTDKGYQVEIMSKWYIMSHVMFGCCIGLTVAQYYQIFGHLYFYVTRG